MYSVAISAVIPFLQIKEIRCKNKCRRNKAYRNMNNCRPLKYSESEEKYFSLTQHRNRGKYTDDCDNKQIRSPAVPLCLHKYQSVDYSLGKKQERKLGEKSPCGSHEFCFSATALRGINQRRIFCCPLYAIIIAEILTKRVGSSVISSGTVTFTVCVP